MAIFHFSAKAVSRSAGRSSTAAAAYRAAECIVDERVGEIHDYTRKGGVVASQVILPGGGTMARAELWNKVEAHHKRGDATVAREFVVALPAELDESQRGDLAKSYARELADRYGVAVDVAVHAPGREGDQRNHHAHILMSACYCGPTGVLGKKAVELDPIHCQRQKLPNVVEVERQRWENIANEALEKAGQEARIDHRSLQAQGIYDRLPGPHLGPAATAIKRRGGVSTVEERAKEQAAQFLADMQAQVALQRAAERDVAELEAELAILRLQALPLDQQRERAEQLVAERRAEIDELAKRRTELSEMLHNRSQPRERVEEAHAKAPGLAKAAKAATARAEAMRAELEATSWLRPFKRARLEREMPEAQERAEQLRKRAAEAEGMASLPIREKVEAAMAELDRKIKPGADLYHDALMELHQLKAQEDAQKAQEAALRRRADMEQARAVAARLEASIASRQQQRERQQERMRENDGPSLG